MGWARPPDAFFAPAGFAPRLRACYAFAPAHACMSARGSQPRPLNTIRRAAVLAPLDVKAQAAQHDRFN